MQKILVFDLGVGFFFFSSQFYQQPNTGLGAKFCDSYWLAYLVGARRQIDGYGLSL